MPDKPEQLLGSVCTQCASPWIRTEGRISCSACQYAPGIVVSSNISARHQRELDSGKIPKQTSPRRARKPSKAKLAMARLNNADLFENTIQPGNTYGTAERKSGTNGDNSIARPLRATSSARRCTTCDRNLILANGTIVCPGCGESHGAVDMINYLKDAFPGAVEVKA